MATLLGTLGVKLSADTAKFTSDMEKASGSVKAFGMSAKSVAAIAGGTFLGVAGAIGVLVKASSAQLEAEIKLASAFRATGESFDPARFKALASSLQEVTTFGDEATIGAGALLAQMGRSQSQIETLIPRIQDLSAATGVDLNTAAQLVGRAFEGQTGALTRYGIVLTDAQKSALQAGDAQQKLAVLTQLLDSRVKGTAAAISKTAVGAFTQFMNAVGDVREEFGKFFEMPVAAIFRTGAKAASAFASIVASIPQPIKTLLGTLVVVAGSIAGIVAAVAAAKLAFVALSGILAPFAAGAIAALSPILLTIGAISAAVLGVILAVGALRQAWDADLGGMKSTVLGFVQTVSGLWDRMTKFIKETFVSAISAIEETFTDVMSFISGKSPDEAFAIQQERQKGGGLLAGAALPDFGAIVGNVGGEIKEIGGDLVNAFDKGVESMFGVKDASGEVSKFFGALTDTTKSLGKSAEETKKTFDDMSGTLRDNLRGKLIPDLGAMDEAIFQAEQAFLSGASAAEAAPFVADIDLDVGRMIIPPETQAELAEGSRAAVGMFVDNIRGSLQAASSTILGGLQGAAADFVSSAREGFQSGGIIGAIFNVVASFLTKTQGFADTLDIINEDLGFLTKALEPLGEAVRTLTETASGSVQKVFKQLGKTLGELGKGLKPFMEAIGTLTNLVNDSIASILRILQPVMAVLGRVLQGLGEMIKFIIGIIAKVTNAIVEVVAKVASVVGLGDEVRKFKIDLDPAREAVSNFRISLENTIESIDKMTVTFADGSKAVVETIDNMASMNVQWQEQIKSLVGLGFTQEQAEKIITQSFQAAGKATVEFTNEITNALGETTDGLDGMNDTLKEVNQELLNAPSGFKAAFRRFQATAIGEPVDLTAQDERAPQGVNVEAIFIDSTNPDEFASALSSAQAFAEFMEKGDSAGSGAPFAVNRAGA